MNNIEIETTQEEHLADLKEAVKNVLLLGASYQEAKQLGKEGRQCPPEVLMEIYAGLEADPIWDKLAQVTLDKMMETSEEDDEDEDEDVDITDEPAGPEAA